MPLKRLVCPHCEQSVEVNTTSVTRSRDCPLCGKSIVIQSSSKGGNRTRAALLMPLEAAAEGAGAEEVGIESPDQPRVLTGDVRRRLMHDPEVRARIRMLKTGGIVGGSIVLFMVLAHLLHLWTGITQAANWLGAKLRPGSGLEQEQAPEREPAAPAPPRPAPEDPMPAPHPEAAPSSGRRAVSIPRDPAVLINVPGADESQVLDSSKAEQKGAVEALGAFLSAKTVDERLKHVRDRSVVEPRMREYYARTGDGPVVFERADLTEENLMGPFTFGFNVLLADGTRRHTLVGKTVGGKYAVDWASFVLFSEMEWAVLRSKRPVEPKMIRALASPSVFFQGAFSSASALVCVRLIDPQHLEAPALFGYAEIDSRVGKALADLAQRSAGRAVPVVLQIKYPPGATEPNQVWVHDLVTEGWVSRKW